MLLRIFLILSILAGAGIIALTHFQVRPHVQSIIDERETQTKRAVKAEGDLRTTRDTLAKTKDTLQRTEGDLEDKKTQLAAATKKANEEQTRANGLQTTLTKTQADLRTANQDLEAWRIFNKTPTEIKQVIDDNKKLLANVDVLKAEYAILEKAHKKACLLITNLVGEGLEIDVPLPAGLKGTILVVDPKWDFVVLDIGEKHGVVQHGVMMVSRESKLIAKIKIVSVQNERCIANIMPNWKLGEVMEGDWVLSPN